MSPDAEPTAAERAAGEAALRERLDAAAAAVADGDADAALVDAAVARVRARRIQDYRDASPPLAEPAALRREIRMEMIRAKLRRGDTLTPREISAVLRRLVRRLR